MSKPHRSSSKPPANRQLTKERVKAALLSLAATGEKVTAAGLLNAAGGRGSFSTLLRLRKEIEAEMPKTAPNDLNLARVLEFIWSCPFPFIPQIERAVAKRQRVVRFDGAYLQVHGNEDEEEVVDGIRAVRAERVERNHWRAKPTALNVRWLQDYGFEPHPEGLLETLARREGSFPGPL